MSDITKRFGIITGGTGSFGSIQYTDGDENGSVTVPILDSSKNLAEVKASLVIKFLISEPKVLMSIYY